MGKFLRSFRSYSWVSFILLSAGSCCVVMGLYAMSSFPVNSQPEQQPPAFLLPEVSLGNANAPHEVIMYFALDCAHCRDYERDTLPQIKERFIDTGQVRFIMRDFPMGPAGLLASRMSWVRRDPQQYLAIINQIFDRQDYWNVAKNYKEKLREVALNIGLTDVDFENCLNDTDLEQAILWQQLQAKDIKEVPTFVIDGEPISEILTPEVLLAFLQKKAAATQAG